MKLWRYIPTLLLFILLACAPAYESAKKITIQTPQGALTIQVEIAETPQERAKGLMLRESLSEDKGMLFIFETEKQQTFWMKDTLIPLDMIFIDSDGMIVDIKTAVPCQNDPCPTYPSQAPAQYVLEVNAGFAQAKNIAEGQTVTI